MALHCKRRILENINREPNSGREKGGLGTVSPLLLVLYFELLVSCLHISFPCFIILISFSCDFLDEMLRLVVSLDPWTSTLDGVSRWVSWDER